VIEGELQIGSILLKSGKNPLIKEIPLDGEKYVVVIEIDTKNNAVQLSPSQLQEESAEEYFYVGNPKGSSSKLVVSSSDLKGVLASLKELSSNEDIDNELKEKLKKAEPILSNYTDKTLQEELKKEFNIASRRVALYTISIDGNPIAKVEAYRKFIAEEYTPPFNETGTCHLCGNSTKVSVEATKKLEFKYFITDKISFAQGLVRDNFPKSFSICKECYDKLKLAEGFISNHMRLNWSKNTLYIIPKFLLNPPSDRWELQQWSNLLTKRINSTYRYDLLAEFENHLEEWRRYEAELKDSYVINLLFYIKTNSAFKVVKLIKDIPPVRLNAILNAVKELKNKADGMLGRGPWAIDFRTISYILDNRKATMEVYDAIFSATRFSFKRIIPILTSKAKEMHHEGKDIHTICLQGALLEALLTRLGLHTKEGGAKVNLDDEVKRFVESMNYDEQETALFLLGCLIGEIGNEQYNRGSKDAKPILNKIAFEGMRKDKLLRLVNETAEKLHQYKRFTKNEAVFSEMKMLLDKNLKTWEKTPQENVFYILSGYSYVTQKAISKGGKENEEQ